MQTETDDEPTLKELDQFDTRNVAAIAFVILAKQVARKTGESQLEIQRDVLIEAYNLFKASSPEGLQCFLAINFPTIIEKAEDENEGDNHHSSEG